MPESEGKLLFCRKPQFERGKNVFQWKPSVDLLESEDVGEWGKTAVFAEKNSIWERENCVPVKTLCQFVGEWRCWRVRKNCNFCRKPQFERGKTLFQWKTLLDWCWLVDYDLWAGLKYTGWSGPGFSSSPRAGPFMPGTNWVGSGALESMAGPSNGYSEILVL